MHDVLLPAVVARYTGADHGWDIAMLGTSERALGLKKLAELMTVSTKWHRALSSRVEAAALRLAQFDLRWEGRAPGVGRRYYVVATFDHLMSVFTKMWTLTKPMPERFRLSPLQDLSTPELSCLRDILRGGWQVRAFVPHGVDWRTQEFMWVAPVERILH